MPCRAIMIRRRGKNLCSLYRKIDRVLVANQFMDNVERPRQADSATHQSRGPTTSSKAAGEYRSLFVMVIFVVAIDFMSMADRFFDYLIWRQQQHARHSYWHSQKFASVYQGGQKQRGRSKKKEESIIAS